MGSRSKKKFFKRNGVILSTGIVLGIIVMLGGHYIYKESSTDESCQICHIHPHAEDSWKLSTHGGNSPSGVRVHCVECHLPPENNGIKYFSAKAKTGMKDLWSYLTKDSAKINWESKKNLEYASKIVYNESCKECHTNLFPPELNDEGITAHLYYDENEKKLDLQCISCHLSVGHYDPNMIHAKMEGLPAVKTDNKEVYTEATPVTEFKNFTEKIPTTSVSFNMIAIPGGTFQMGSPEDEPFRKENEGPVRNVTISPFFMGEIEVTWDMYWAFYAQTMSEGRIAPDVIRANNATDPEVDAISGPTPPFGFPDQGWGGIDRPAITMTHYAAEIFCQWLSKRTGKHYRLPTEAEWEYAARGGTQTPYFFEGNPKKFSDQGFIRKFFDADTAVINSFVAYAKNSNSKSMEPSKISPNPFGLKNMLGNVMEYCSDWYADDAYAQTPTDVTDPKGPESGTEHVVRGGDFTNDAADVRCASRAASQHDNWLKTDPQQPKSIWWYSDTKSVGFRVVCDMPEQTPENNP